MLELKEVTLRYPNTDFQLGPVNLSIQSGECIGILGKNGAGKTSLFQLITGNRRVSSGHITLQGATIQPDKHELKRQIGYLPQAFELPRWVSGQELLHYAIALYGLDEAESRLARALDYWDCDFYRTRPLSSCSHGMKKRVGLALATIHDPPLLILDEPFSGLDLYHIKALQDEIIRRSQAGSVTILSTHIAPYAARLCEAIMLVDNGQMSSIEHWQELDALQRAEQIERHFFDI